MSSLIWVFLLPDPLHKAIVESYSFCLQWFLEPAHLFPSTLTHSSPTWIAAAATPTGPLPLAYPYLIYPLCCDSIVLAKKAVLIAILSCSDPSLPSGSSYAPQWGIQGLCDWASTSSSCLPSPHLLTHLPSGHGKQRDFLKHGRSVSPPDLHIGWYLGLKWHLLSLPPPNLPLFTWPTPYSCILRFFSEFPARPAFSQASSRHPCHIQHCETSWPVCPSSVCPTRDC